VVVGDREHQNRRHESQNEDNVALASHRNLWRQRHFKILLEKREMKFIRRTRYEEI
jgi:hypothetical protein